MDLTDDEGQLLLAGLFVLNSTHAADNDDEREAIKALVRKLGGDLEATFFRSAEGGHSSPERSSALPGCVGCPGRRPSADVRLCAPAGCVWVTVDRDRIRPQPAHPLLREMRPLSART